MRFYHSKGGRLIDPAIKLFTNKIIPSLLYGIEVWGRKEQALSGLESIQNTFMRCVLALPKGAPTTLMRAELGLPSFRARAHLALLKWWKKNTLSVIDFFSHQCFNSATKVKGPLSAFIDVIISLYTVPDDLLAELGNNKDLREWVFLQDAKIDRSLIVQSRCSPWFKTFKIDHCRSPYLANLNLSKLRVEFSALRFQSMPSSVLSGRYAQIPLSHRLCICGNPVVEDLPHYLLECPLYADPRRKFLIKIIPGVFSSSQDKLRYLLSDMDPFVTQRVATFALAARKIRAGLVANTVDLLNN